LSSQVGRLLQEFLPAFPLCGVPAQERGLMFVPRIENEPRPRLDDRAELQRCEQVAHMTELRAAMPGIERMVVDRDGHTAVTERSKDDQRVFQPVMGEAVGVVAQEHGAMITDSAADTLARRYAASGCRRPAAPSLYSNAARAKRSAQCFTVSSGTAPAQRLCT